MNETIQTLKSEMQDVLQSNILPFWLHKMRDNERGGYYGQMTGEGQLVKDAPRGCILNARILWSFAAAYRVLGDREYRDAAYAQFEYCCEHFMVYETGACYWSITADGEPLDTKNQFYALGFMLYGMSEFLRALRRWGCLPGTNMDERVVECCHRIFNAIEQHAFDPVNNGYIEALSSDWQPLADMRLSDLDANYPKSQNTHLHIIEPYTNLLNAFREGGYLEAPTEPCRHDHLGPRVAYAVRNLISIFTDRILNPETHHLDLFFEMDWTRGAGWLESYGHDIECSWLLHEAALVLGDQEVLAHVEPIVRLVAKASEKGLNADGSMTHEANLDTGHVDADRHWWVQAETVVGFINIYQHFGDESALQKALACWQYIKDNLIDHELGEWYWSRDAERHINRRDDHAGFWKCPYHNSRMCLEVIERKF